MNTIQPSIDSSSRFADWLSDAVGLVQRVNARVRRDPRLSQVRQGRQVLSDRRCLELAGLVLPDLGA